MILSPPFVPPLRFRAVRFEGPLSLPSYELFFFNRGLGRQRYIDEGTVPKSVSLGARWVGWVGEEVQGWILASDLITPRAR
ncbi:AlpA family phage regulatory protein [Pseudomonas sp. PWP3-1b2]|uniref:AlpA family phage regulatory protein n=1 Tax=Pseudomonas sp. PWP3-1b2 TaxID=2804656 RepID=UPI003CF28FB7